MNEQRRWRLWTRLFLAIPVVGLLLLAVALATQSFAVMLVALAVPPVFAVGVVGASVRARRRSGVLVPPELQGLHEHDRRIVSAAVNGGGRVADPELAAAVVAHARRQQIVNGLLLAVGAFPVFTGAARLASERFDDRAFLNVAVIAGWLVLASIHVLSVLRARRAIEANRPDVG